MFNRQASGASGQGSGSGACTGAQAAAAPPPTASASASASLAAAPLPSQSPDLYLRPLPFLDAKWLRADLIASLRNAAEGAVLWNHLIQDCELVSSPAAPLLNARGQLSYLGDDGKHYCGAQQLKCSCCQPDYCGPLSACNCDGCRPLDSDTAIKKLTTQAAAQQAAQLSQATDMVLSGWLWSQPPSHQARQECQRSLISELQELALRAAGNCLSAQHLRQQLFVYERYFVALKRERERSGDKPPPPPQIAPPSPPQPPPPQPPLPPPLPVVPTPSTPSMQHQQVWSYSRRSHRNTEPWAWPASPPGLPSTSASPSCAAPGAPARTRRCAASC